MLEVLLAMTIAVLVIGSFATSFYRMLTTEKRRSNTIERLFKADNLFFDVVKYLIKMEAYDRQCLLQEGLSTYFDQAQVDIKVIGFNPLKKRPYYLLEIDLKDPAGPLGSYNMIVKNEALFLSH